MPDNHLFDQMMSDPNAQVTLIIYSSKVVPPPNNILTGFLQQDFSFNSQASWNSPFETFGGIFKLLNSVRNLASTLIASTGFKDLAQKIPIPMSFAQTIKDYMGSTPPEFDLTMTFVATKDADQKKPVSNISTLLACTSPVSSSSTPGSVLDFMKPPLGYVHALTNPEDGVVNLKIGQWLQIPKLLISSVRPTYSKQVGKLGFPIYTTAQIHFEYFRTPSYEEIQSWFTGKFISLDTTPTGDTGEVKDKTPSPPNNIPVAPIPPPSSIFPKLGNGA
jgi:hypothetical protein